MKKLLLAVLLLGHFCFSQQINFNKKDSLSMDNEVVPYMEEFVQEAQDRGYYVRFLLMRKIDFILFHEGLGTAEGDNRIGVVSENGRGIYLSPKIKGNPIKMRLTIYHEIGHIIKGSGDHSCKYCYDIMSEYSPPDLQPYLDPKFWKNKVDRYFEWLDKS